MTAGADAVLVFLILTNLALLGASRMQSCIRIVSLQGAVLGLLPLLAPDGVTARTAALAAGTVAIKGAAFPWLLHRALQEAHVRREIEPHVGFTLSMLLGVPSLAAALWLSERMPPPRPGISSLVTPVAFFSLYAGLFLVVARRKALTQVIGYLAFENGIYAFGVGMAVETPFLVELGVLLDVCAAVFVMGIAIFHISREFDSLDTDRLADLRDWTP